MSYRLVLAELSDRGKLRAGQFLQTNPRSGLRVCLKYGFVKANPTKRSADYTYEITPLGRAFLENRYELVVPEIASTNGRAKGTARILVATWLKSLPSDISVKG